MVSPLRIMGEGPGSRRSSKNVWQRLGKKTTWIRHSPLYFISAIRGQRGITRPPLQRGELKAVADVLSLALLFAHTPFSVLISFGNFLSKKRCFTRMKSVSSPMDCSVKFLIKYCIRKRNSGVRGEEFSLTNKRETRRREYP